MFDDVIARLAVSLSMEAGEFATGSTSVQKELAKLQGAVQSLGDKWMAAGKRLTVGVTAPLAAIGIASAKAASDAQELDSAFGQTFGNLAGEMRSWAEATGDALNRSTEEIKRAANAFGIFFNQAAPTREEAAKMAQTFTVLAQDLASFFNVSESDALEKLRSGLTGETEPLRDFGVFLNEATVANKALEMGLAASSKELTEQDKILARYNLILEGTRDAQGDVTRTAGSAANQARGFMGALEDLQVVIGEKLLPLLTPLITAATDIVNGFAGLPSPVQNVIIGIGALAAAMGPLMLIMGTLAATLLPLFAARFGPIGIAISAFINPLGTAISLLAQFAVRLGGMAILKTIGGLLLRFAGPVGLIASAGLLIYKNWDGISAVFQEFFKNAEMALGPPLQELVAAVRDLFAALWEGPLGDGIQTAMALLGDLAGALEGAFGDALIAVLTYFLDSLTWVLTAVGDAIRVVAALLRGDWQGAWDAAVVLVANLIEPFRNFGTHVVQIMQSMVAGVKTWLQDRLGAIFAWVGEKTRQVTGFFFEMYDAVVGNSYVPDMVAGIAAEMARLQAVMVDPARKATSDVIEATRQMARDVASLLDRLFPQFAEARRQAEDLKLLDDAADKGLISDDLRRQGRFRVLGGGKDATVSDDILNSEPLTTAMGEISTVLEGLGDKTEIQTVRIAESFRDMAQNTVRSLEDMVGAIKGGGFLDILGSAIDLFLQLASTGLFGSGLAASVNTARIPAFAQGTRSAPGGLAIVGERGPELVDLPRGSRVISNRDLRAANDSGGRGHITVGIDPRNGNVTAYVDGRIAATAPAVANAGAMQARAMSARSARRTIRR